MAAIYKRELRSYFRTFIGWLFLAVTFFLLGIYFTVYNLLSGYPTISYVLQSAVFLFIVTIPILTMRSLAEERKNRTDQLILTAPVSVVQVVLGKYFALITILAVPTVLIGLTPVALMQAGEFQVGISYTSLLGFFLYGCLAMAIGLFISSTTESVVISAVLSLVVLFVGYIMSGLCNILSMGSTSLFSEYLVKVLQVFDLVGRFDDLCSGYLELQSVVYYLTFIVFMLFVTVQSIQKRRYSVSGKGVRLGAYSVSGIVLLGVLLVAANIGLSMLPEKYTSFDVTANKVYTLTEDTKKMLAGVDRDVAIYVLADEGSKDTDLDKTLQQVDSLSKYISVSYISPVSNPKFYYNYTQEQPSDNSLIVVSDTNSTVVDYNDIYVTELDYSTYQSKITGYDGEGQIASAISYVLTDEIPLFYVITGHNELDFEESFLNAITKENVRYEMLELYTVDSIPEDAEGIIINAPTTDFSEDDVKKVTDFLQKGKNALLVPTWTEESLPNFEKILDYYGVSMVDGMIVEQDRNYYYTQSPYYLIPSVQYDTVTEKINGQHVFAPFAKGLVYDEESEDIHYTSLLKTSESAFSKKDISDVSDYKKAADDEQGPFVISLKAERSADDGKETKAVIVATESLFTGDADAIFPGNNMKLFGSIISDLAEYEQSVSIPAKSYDIGFLSFNAQISLMAGILAVIVLPLGCLITGLVVWLKRRKK